MKEILIDHITAKRESDERTSVLANERTYAAWIRTGLTALATGLGIAKFLPGTFPLAYVGCIALILVAFSGFCFILAGWRYDHVARRIVSTHVSGAPRELLSVISVMLMVAVFLSFVGIVAIYYF